MSCMSPCMGSRGRERSCTCSRLLILPGLAHPIHTTTAQEPRSLTGGVEGGRPLRWLARGVPVGCCMPRPCRWLAPGLCVTLTLLGTSALSSRDWPQGQYVAVTAGEQRTQTGRHWQSKHFVCCLPGSSAETRAPTVPLLLSCFILTTQAAGGRSPTLCAEGQAPVELRPVLPALLPRACAWLPAGAASAAPCRQTASGAGDTEERCVSRDSWP